MHLQFLSGRLTGGSSEMNQHLQPGCISQTQRVALAQHTHKKGLTGAFCGSSNHGHQEPLHPFPTPSLHPWPATPHQLHFKLGGRSGPSRGKRPAFAVELSLQPIPNLLPSLTILVNRALPLPRLPLSSPHHGARQGP